MLEKLQSGILHVLTDSGLHYVKPSFWERVQLVWIFRNFSALPQQVLSASHQHLLSTLCDAQRMFRCSARVQIEHTSVIGTLLTSVLPHDGAPERRCQSRNSINFEVRYSVAGGESYRGEGEDISEGGMCFSGAAVYPPGTELELRYRLPEQAKWTRVRALVRHRDGTRMRVKFLSLRDSGRAKLFQISTRPDAPASH